MSSVFYFERGSPVKTLSQLFQSFLRVLVVVTSLSYTATMAKAQGAPIAPDTPPTTNDQIPAGLVFADEATYNSIPLATAPLLGTLPPSADLSSRFPTPRDQGSQGSCVGWALAYALKSYQEGAARNWPLSEDDHLFSPSFVYNQLRQSIDCKGGIRYIDALNLLRQKGVATLQDFDYTPASCSALPNQSVKQGALQYVIGKWRRVNVQDETEVKSQLASGFPVLVGIVVDDGFHHLQGAQPYSQYSGANPAGHAVVLVGYDDTLAGGAFKLINSWGTTWGASGFGWISYTTFAKMVREGYIVETIEPTAANANSPVIRPPGQLSVTPPVNVPPVTPFSVTASAPTISFNVGVQPPTGGPQQLGMKITVPGSILNGQGKSFQMVARFNFVDGSPLRANPVEVSYRDATGFVATGTPVATINTSSVDLAPFYMTIPYYALNLAPTAGHTTYSLTLNVSIYVNGFLAYQTTAVPFGVVW
jgi:C1A family cysteine protease